MPRSELTTLELASAKPLRSLPHHRAIREKQTNLLDVQKRRRTNFRTGSAKAGTVDRPSEDRPSDALRRGPRLRLRLLKLARRASFDDPLPPPFVQGVVSLHVIGNIQMLSVSADSKNSVTLPCALRLIGQVNVGLGGGRSAQSRGSETNSKSRSLANPDSSHRHLESLRRQAYDRAPAFGRGLQ
jgi:hypothetical protein